MAFDVNALAPFLFRAGYHAWRHMRAPDYPAIGAEAEARETKGALQEADQIAKDHDGVDGGVKQARSHMESRELEVKIKDGRVINLVRSLESYLRNHSDKCLWGWWHVGLNTSALELLQKDELAAVALAEKESIQKGILETREALKIALGVAGMPAAGQEPIEVMDPSEAIDAIREYLKKCQALPRNLDLLRLRAQHATDRFPDEDLLRRLDCTSEGIAFLKLLYDRRPHPVSYDEAAKFFRRVSNAMAQRYAAIPEPVREILLLNVGRNRQKAWRPRPTD